MHTHGISTYGIGATHSSNLKIINNTILATPSTEGTSHVPILLGDCHYNTISYNNLEVIVQEPYTKFIVLNGIYLSTYGSGLIEGGACNYNNISHNTIKGYDSVWCYTIQMMGNNNLALNNTVSGGSIGISSPGTNNKVINNTIHATETGISAGTNNTVTGNIITLTNGATGISTSANNCIIQNNEITTTNKPGISLTNSASNSIIENNKITTKTGNGIYIQGTGQNNNIKENTINSEATGILFKQQSKQKCPKNNYIISNTIETTADYAIDAYESENTLTQKNHLTSKRGNNDNAIKANKVNSGGIILPISGKTYTLNDTSYSNYFYSNGTLKENVGLKDIFNLNGPLYNKNITITTPITINGNQNTLYNSTIKVLADGAETTIKNINIINDNQIGIILKDTENVNVENNTLTVNQSLESYGIYLHGSSYNTIKNNTITSYGEFVNFGILIYSSDNNKVQKNKVNTIACDNELPYQDDIMLNENIGIIPQIYTTYGIIAIYSSKNNINENIVNLTSEFTEPKNVTEKCGNSMVGIDIYYDSHYNTANNNQVNVIGNNPYSYGMGVLGSEKPTGEELETAKGNTFENNNINVFGNYFATGFIAGLGSVDTIIKNNTITTQSNAITYGATFEASQRSTLISNNITLNSPAIYGIELFDSNKNTIKENNINATGYYKYGIAGATSSENEITDNTITTKKTNIVPTINEAQHSDVIRIGDTGILLMRNSTSNLIKSNKITTDSEYTINLTKSENNTITENSLVAKDTIANKNIYTDSDNKIETNEGYSLSITTNDVVSSPGSTVTLKALVNSTSGNSDGLKVTFTIGLTNIGTAITKNGVAEITYKIPTNWKYAYYDLKVVVSGENYLTKTITKTLELKKLNNNNPNEETQPTPDPKPETTETPKTEEPKTQPTEKTQTNTKVTLTATKVTTVSKKAKKLVLSTKLKIGKTKNNKGKTVTYIINGKTYKVKTNRNGVAKITIKKSDLKKLIKKGKSGKKIKYKIKYGKTTVTKYIKVK